MPQNFNRVPRRRDGKWTVAKATNTFIAELKLARPEVLVKVLESPEPCNPIGESCSSRECDIRTILGLLVETKLVDWGKVKGEVCHMLAERYISTVIQRSRPLEDPWVGEWVSAWSARNLDKIVSFFSEDAQYHAIGGVEPAIGKTAVRVAVADLLRLWRTSMQNPQIDSVTREVTLEWVRTGAPRSFRSMSPKPFLETRGHSVLKADGSFYDSASVQLISCSEKPGPAELPEHLSDLQPCEAAGPCQLTESEVVYPNGLRIPRSWKGLPGGRT